MGTCNTTPEDLVLKDNTKPVCSRPYPVPRVHRAMLKKEVKRLVSLGVIKHSNESEWGEPYFPQPKAKTNRLILLSNFRNLNRKLKRKTYPKPKIREMLLKLEGFKYAMSMDLNIGYYHIHPSKETRNLCNIILPQEKYGYKRLPMGVSNSPEIFQEKMNEMFLGFEFIREYTTDLLIITRGDWSDNLETLYLTLKILKTMGLSVIPKSYSSGKPRWNI